MKPSTIRLHADDNVIVAVDALEADTTLPHIGLNCQDPIPAGHKIAAADIAIDQPIVKYGQIIGFAREAIGRGRHVHTHNVYLKDLSRDYAFAAQAGPADRPLKDGVVFQGIVRGDGSVATRNYIGIIPMVACSAGVSRLIARSVSEQNLKNFPRVDGVTALAHDSGCGMSGVGEGFDLLQRALAGFARHPNFAGVLLVGLGCEVNQLDSLMQNMDLQQGPLLRTLNLQEAGGTLRAVARGVEMVREMLAEADRAVRRPVSASHLVLGLECGGSDAYSGISANPSLGAAADLVVRHGGTAILSETPEIYGAEHLLTRRAINRSVGEKLVGRIHWWEDYTALLGAELNNNPSPGNKAGGLTTILEKSLGAMAKGGTSTLVDVYGYAEQITQKGLVFMDTPGHDLVSITGMIAGGANTICFTTGRGTVCGSNPAPTIKLASNSAMFNRMPDDMDINCGRVIDGDVDVQAMGQVIFEHILLTASGTPSKSERLGLGDNEFSPWHMGAVI